MDAIFRRRRENGLTKKNFVQNVKQINVLRTLTRWKQKRVVQAVRDPELRIAPRRVADDGFAL